MKTRKTFFRNGGDVEETKEGRRLPLSATSEIPQSFLLTSRSYDAFTF